MGRIVGVDVARGLAVLGMFTAHLGTAGNAYPPRDALQVADGRSAATFALLAGVSIALLSGGAERPGGDRLRRDRARVLTRAVLVLLLHWPLVLLGTPVLVILGSYAVMFALVVPVLTARPPVLFGLAGAVVALVAPVVVLVEEDLRPAPEVAAGVPRALLDLVVTGPYPAVVWVGYVLVGLGVGRLGLTRRVVQAGMLGTGAVLMLLGYGIPWLTGWGGGDGTVADLLGTVEPHSDTPLELAGNTGFALVLLALCLIATGPLRTVLLPVAATGALALTSYVVHVFAIALLGRGVVHEPRTEVLVTFLLVTLVVTTAWWLLLGRGPLERLLHTVSVEAADAVVPPDAPAPAGRQGGGEGPRNRPPGPRVRPGGPD